MVVAELVVELVASEACVVLACDEQSEREDRECEKGGYK